MLFDDFLYFDALVDAHAGVRGWSLLCRLVLAIRLSRLCHLRALRLHGDLLLHFAAAGLRYFSLAILWDTSVTVRV